MTFFTTALAQAPRIWVIRVHLLEGRTSRPVKKGVEIHLGESYFPKPGVAATLAVGRTDRAGMVAFKLTQPPPRWLYIAPEDFTHWTGCNQSNFCASRALERGVAEENLCWPFWHKHGPAAPRYQAQPGEVYIYAHHFTAWTRTWLEAFGLSPGPYMEAPPPDPDCRPVAAPITRGARRSSRRAVQRTNGRRESGSGAGRGPARWRHVTGVTFGSGDSDAFGFDAKTGRMTSYGFAVNGQSDSGALTWNGDGSLAKLAITDLFSAGDTQTCSHSRDDMGRLSGVNCGSEWNQTFALDALRNVATASGNNATCQAKVGCSW